MGIDFSEVERFIFLKNVDGKWIDHIDAMTILKRGISLRGYAHENPINAFKREGLNMFDEMIENIQNDTVRILLKGEIRENPVRRASVTDAPVRPQGTVTRTVKKVGRNDPCPCGSGQKYKNCCGKN